MDYYYEPTHPFNSSLCIRLSQSICVHWIIIIDSIHNIQPQILNHSIQRKSKTNMKTFRKISFLKCLIFPLSLTISGYISRQLLFHDGFFFLGENFHNHKKSQSNQDAAATKIQNNIPKIQKQMLRKKTKTKPKTKTKKTKNKKPTTKKQKTKTKKQKTKIKKKKHELLTYVFKTVAILTIEPTVKSHFKFNISQKKGWRKVSLKIKTQKEKIIIKLKIKPAFFEVDRKFAPF